MFNNLVKEGNENGKKEEEDDNNEGLVARALGRLREQTENTSNSDNRITLEENAPEIQTETPEENTQMTTTRQIRTTTTVVKETTGLKIFSNSQEAGSSSTKTNTKKRVTKKINSQRQQAGGKGKKTKTKGELYEEIRARDVIITALKGSIGLLKEQAKISRKDNEKLERYLLNLERNLIAREHPKMGLSETQFLLSHNSHDEIIKLKHDLHSAIDLIKNLNNEIDVSGMTPEARTLVEEEGKEKESPL